MPFFQYLQSILAPISVITSQWLHYILYNRQHEIYDIWSSSSVACLPACLGTGENSKHRRGIRRTSQRQYRNHDRESSLCVFDSIIVNNEAFPPPLRLSLEILRETQRRTNAENVPGGCGGCGTYQSAHGDVFVQQHDRTHMRKWEPWMKSFHTPKLTKRRNSLLGKHIQTHICIYETIWAMFVGCGFIIKF